MIEVGTYTKDKGLVVRKYTDYVLSRCDELLNYAEIRRIILVFDGNRCPLKAGTNSEREMKR